MNQIIESISKKSYTLTPDIILGPDGPLKDHSLTISNGTIEKISKEKPDESVDLSGYAIIPGFVDAHTHTGQTFGKALTAGEPAQIWKRIWNPMEAAHTRETSYASAKWMFLEALRGGYTSLVNFSMNSLDLNKGVHKAVSETGIRLVSSTGLDQYYFDENGKRVDHSFDQVVDAINLHVAECKGNNLLTPSVCSTSFFTNSDDTLSKLYELCEKKDIKLQIHSNEHFPEVHECITRFGLRPIEKLNKLNVLGKHLLIHHATLVTDHEIELLANSSTGVSYNPLASIWKGNSVAPALAFKERNVTFGIGSDTTSADALKSLSAAETCQRIRHSMPVDDFSCGAAWTWTTAASFGSAKAAGIETKTGSLREGLAADFLILDMGKPECIPSIDFEWELVRYYNRDQIVAVAIGGKPVMVNGEPIGWDADEFLKNYIEIAKSVSSTSTIQRVHGKSETRRFQSSHNIL